MRSQKELDSIIKLLKEQQNNILLYLKSRYPLFHKSNVFYRDIQFGIKYYLENKEIKLSYSESEYIANKFIEYLISQNILQKISDNIYILNYPEFSAKQSSQKVKI